MLSGTSTIGLQWLVLETNSRLPYINASLWSKEDTIASLRRSAFRHKEMYFPFGELSMARVCFHNAREEVPTHMAVHKRDLVITEGKE